MRAVSIEQDIVIPLKTDVLVLLEQKQFQSLEGPFMLASRSRSIKGVGFFDELCEV